MPLRARANAVDFRSFSLSFNQPDLSEISPSQRKVDLANFTPLSGRRSPLDAPSGQGKQGKSDELLVLPRLSGYTRRRSRESCSPFLIE